MARMDRLTVRGFKSIRALEDFELRNLNVLIGANGAGKSNLLSLFRMLEQLSRKRLQLFVRESGGPERLLFGGPRRTSSVSADVVFDGGRRRYGFSLEPVGGDRMAFASESLPVDDDGMVFASESLLPGIAGFDRYVARRDLPIESGNIEWPGGHVEAHLADCDGGGFASYVLPEMQRWRVFHFQDVGRLARVRQPAAVRDNLCLQEDAGNLAPFLRRLRERHPAHYRQVVDAVRIAAPFFGDFLYRDDLNPDDRMELEWFQDSHPDAVLGTHQISDGTLRFLGLATLLLQPVELQPSVILLDEPELGLHPAVLTVLAEILRTASDGRQVIVATQSADLVSELAPEDVVVVDRKDDASVFRRLDGDDLRGWLEDYSLGDLWRMNVVGGRP